jgi:hypothetical protein
MSHQGNKKILLLTSSLLIACLSLLVFPPACVEKIHPLTIENQTSTTLHIYVSAVYRGDNSIDRVYHVGDVLAVQTTTIRDSAIVPNVGYDYLIEAKNDNDDVLFSRLYTIDELEDLDWKIVITPLPGG